MWQSEWGLTCWVVLFQAVPVALQCPESCRWSDTACHAQHCGPKCCRFWGTQRIANRKRGCELDPTRWYCQNRSSAKRAVSVATLRRKEASALAQTSAHRRLISAFDLNGSYSSQLYGAPGRVQSLEMLQIIWLGMLPSSAWAALAAVGVCRADRQLGTFLLPQVPDGSLYMPHSKMANPNMSLWHKQPEATANTPVPSHGWVEVTHCASSWCQLRHQGWKPNSGAVSCSSSSSWFYVARGSGVSINVGKTLVLDEDALSQRDRRVSIRRLLRDNRRNREPSAWMNDAIDSLRSDAANFPTSVNFQRRNALAAALNLSAAHVLSLNSIQRIFHREGWGSVARHEVILVDLKDMTDADALHGNSRLEQIACGRWPYLFPCTASSAPLQYMATCSDPAVPFEWHMQQQAVKSLLRTCWDTRILHEDASPFTMANLTNSLTRDVARPAASTSRHCDDPDKDVAVRWASSVRPVWDVRNMSSLSNAAPAPRPARLARIFWSHFPKTGTGFAHTVFTYACGFSFDPGRISTRDGVPRLFGDCNGSRSVLQSACWQTRLSSHERWGIRTDMGDWLHQPVPWELDDERPRSVHPAVGNLVAFFRSPRARLISSLRYVKAHAALNDCCGEGWGFPSVHLRNQIFEIASNQSAVISLLERMASGTVPVHLNAAALSAQACQTKMLLGYGCFQPKWISTGQGDRAVHVVTNAMAFVGVHEEWDKSICLWHARFGQTLWSNQLKAAVASVRPDSKVKDETSSLFAAGTALHDSVEEATYAAARSRFQREIQEYLGPVQDCLRSVRAYRARLYQK